MFSSINFLFLLSLGFISWTILCYIQQFEQMQPNIKTPQTVLIEETPASIINTPKEASHFAKESIYFKNKFDLYINFLGVFVCIYVLAKITLLAETYMAKRIRHKIYIPKAIDNDTELPNESLDELREQQDNLKWKLNKLEEQNQAMKLKLKDVIQSKAPYSRHIHADLEENIRSVIITNKHIHLTGQIFVNQDEIQHKNNMELKEFNNELDDNINIWDKYLQLQKQTALVKPISPVTDTDLHASMPVVMSSQELESIKGIF